MSKRAGLSLVKSSEGCKLKAYLCPAGIPTIGYGETRGVYMGMVITQQEAETMLINSYDEFEQGVLKLVKVSLNENQLGALVSFAYNLGLGNLKKSTLLLKINKKDFAGAAECFMSWTRGGGKILPGLVKRRTAEKQLFLTP